MTTIRTIARKTRDILGEGPVWSPSRNAVFWVDIVGQRVNRLLVEDDKVDSWHVPERIGWIIEREGRDDFIIGLKSGFAELSLNPFQVRPIGDPEPDRPHNRMNDAKTDSAGRIWAGSMDDRHQEATGALYRFDAGFTWSRHDDGYFVTNGPAFSPDGRTMYHTDSARRTVFALDLSKDGNLGSKRVFVRFEDDWGYPDGMVCDRKGAVWIAHWGGARISRFTADGALDHSIVMPARNITSIVFAGRALDRMFVTSSMQGCEDEPLAGSLFEVAAGVHGCPVRPFAG